MSAESRTGSAGSLATTMRRLGLWPIRVLWFALAVVFVFGLAEALDAASVDGVSDRVETVAWVGLAAGWFAGLVALLAPSTVGLTVLRCVAPAAPAAALLAAITTGTWTAGTLGAIGAGLVVTVAAFAPLVGDIMINGSAYGPERRMALRPPAALLLGPIQVTWLLMFAGLVTGPLLAASGRWLLGGALTVVGFAVVWAGLLRLHQLARRWVVFVPAGFVLHDFFALAESLLMQRRQIVELGPTPLTKGELLDLTGGAAGLSLMAQLDEPVPLALRAKSEVQTFSAHRIVFAPTLPGELLREARIRAIKIASAPQD